VLSQVAIDSVRVPDINTRSCIVYAEKTVVTLFWKVKATISMTCGLLVRRSRGKGFYLSMRKVVEGTPYPLYFAQRYGFHFEDPRCFEAAK